MKTKFFYALLALICAAFISCSDDSNPTNNNIQNKDSIKIFNFSPTSGSCNSEVVLYGKNLLKDSILSVNFNDKPAEITLKTDDSLITIVPNDIVDSAAISIHYPKKIYTFDKFFKIIKDNNSFFSEIESFIVTFNNLHILYRNQFSTFFSPNPATGYDKTSEIFNFCKKYSSSNKIFIDKLNVNEYKLSEIAYYDGKSNLFFKVDDVNSILNYLDIDILIYTTYPSTTSEWYVITLNLQNVPFEKSKDFLRINLSGNSLDSNVKSIYHAEKGTYHQGQAYSEYTREIKQFLNQTDSSNITIILSR